MADGKGTLEACAMKTLATSHNVHKGPVAPLPSSNSKGKAPGQNSVNMSPLKGNYAGRP